MMFRLMATVGLLALATPAVAEPDYAAAIRADYDKDLGALFDWFHRNPELSFKEVNTGARMAKELRAAGATVTDGVGGTGVVAVIANGKGPTVLIRADMDGLPVKEASGLPNMSTVRQVGIDGVENPVMHACGHDTHITALVATARRLTALKARWKGTVVMIVQPAEERLGGAAAMMRDGLYKRFPKPDFALAFHVDSSLPTGTIAASEGISSSSADSIDIVVQGIGAHGAAPDKGKDPIYMASQIVVALQGLIGREKAPLTPGVITVGTFHAGTKNNIIPDEAKLQLTVRANDETTRAALVSGVRRVAEGVARMNGMPDDKLPKVTLVEGTPTTINDAALARRLNASLARDLGPGVVTLFEQVGMGAEDFAYFIQPDTKVKGYYFNVGGTPKAVVDAGKAPPHHSPVFRIDPKPAVILGATAMTAAVLEVLK